MVASDPRRIRARVAAAAAVERARPGSTPDSIYRVRARIRVAEVATAVAVDVRAGFRITRGGRTIEFQRAPQVILDRASNLIGIDALVRVFVGANEQQVDPHRIFVHPPTMVHDGTFTTITNRFGHSVDLPNSREDPLEAYYQALEHSLTVAPNPLGWNTNGTVTTVFSATGDGYVISRDDAGLTYAAARNGTGAPIDTFTTEPDIYLGQQLNPNPQINLVYFRFDTSTIGAGQTVSAVDASLWGVFDGGTQAFTLEMRTYDYGAALTSADYQPGATYAALPLLASKTSATMASGSYNLFTDSGLFPDAIQVAGFTGIVVGSSRFAGNNAPAGAEYWGVASADEVGTVNDPKLVITHAAASTTPVDLPPTRPQITRPPTPGPGLRPWERQGARSADEILEQLTDPNLLPPDPQAFNRVLRPYLRGPYARGPFAFRPSGTGDIVSTIVAEVAALSGSTTPTGGLLIAVSIALAGASTPTGAITRAVAETLSGSSTPTGSLLLAVSLALAGATTPTGALTYAVALTLTGSTTPTGSISRAVALALAGSTTPTGFASLAVALTNFAGATTPTGGTILGPGLGLGGATTPVGAIIAVAVTLALAGSTTPTGAAGLGAAIPASGSTTPTGAIILGAGLGLGGSTTPTGSLAAVAVALAQGGSTTPIGSLLLAVALSLQGATTPTGAITLAVGQALSGSTTPTGGLLLAIGYAAGGSTTPSGTLPAVAVTIGDAGSTTPTGDSNLGPALGLAGATTPVGSVPLFAVGLLLSGSSTPTSTLSFAVALTLNGLTTPTGTFSPAVSLALDGSTTPTGDLTTTLAVTSSLSGSTTPTGDISSAAATSQGGNSTPTGTAGLAVAVSLGGSVTPTGDLSTELVSNQDQPAEGSIAPSGSITLEVNLRLAGVTTPTGTTLTEGGTPGVVARRRDGPLVIYLPPWMLPEVDEEEVIKPRRKAPRPVMAPVVEILAVPLSPPVFTPIHPPVQAQPVVETPAVVEAERVLVEARRDYRKSNEQLLLLLRR